MVVLIQLVGMEQGSNQLVLELEGILGSLLVLELGDIHKVQVREHKVQEPVGIQGKLHMVLVQERDKVHNRDILQILQELMELQ